MCCSVTPDIEVKFSGTVLYGAEVEDAKGRIVHVLGYENIAKNRVGPVGLVLSLLRLKHCGNAMILPFPAVPRTMTSANVLDTEKCPHILKDISDAVKPPPMPAKSFSMGSEISADFIPEIQIFEASGIYTVVLAQDARAIPDALSEVPAKKRPKLNPKLFEDYARWYPDWTFALCCFNNVRARHALPMLWWYEPMNPEELFLPALDSHDGSSPDLKAEVSVDHAVAVGSTQNPKEKIDLPEPEQSPEKEEDLTEFPESAQNPEEVTPFFKLPEEERAKYESPLPYPGFGSSGRVNYRDRISENLQPYLLNYVRGGEITKMLPNGDFVCDLEELRRGFFSYDRKIPPGA